MRLASYYRGRVVNAIAQGESRAEAFPIEQREWLSTWWLSAVPQVDGPQRSDALDEVFGGVEAIGRARDFWHLVEAMNRESIAESKSLQEVAREFSARSYLQNYHLLGGEAVGHCLFEMSARLDATRRNREVPAGVPVEPRLRFNSTARRCLAGQTLYVFSSPTADVAADGAANPAQPAVQAVELPACFPAEPISPYTTEHTERFVGRILSVLERENQPGDAPEPTLKAEARQSGLVELLSEATALAGSGEIAAFVPQLLRALLARKAERPDAAQLDAACLRTRDGWPSKPELALRAKDLSDTLRLAIQSGRWGASVTAALGIVRAPKRTSTTGSTTRQKRRLLRALQAAQYTVEVPDAERLTPIFGEITDSFTDYHAQWAFLEIASVFDSIFDRLLGAVGDEFRQVHTERDALFDSIDAVARRSDVVRYIIGRRRVGWCLYRQKARLGGATEPESSRPVLAHTLRYCLAGNQLMAFEEGQVKKTWDATGFTRRAPGSAPIKYMWIYDANDPQDQQRAELEEVHGALMKRFLDSLVAGNIDGPAELSVLKLSKGAELIDPATMDAMRRMIVEDGEKYGAAD